MMRNTVLAAAIGATLVVGACAQQQQAPDQRAVENPAKYARDRDLCVAQSDEYMRDRRRVNDQTADTFANTQDQMGRGGLQTTMSNYSDSRSADKFIASCMEARGWPQAQKSWWQKIGG
jgi:hypothetical protein